MDKSKRNGNAGKHPSYKAKGMTPAQIKKKVARDKKYSATPEQKKKRAATNKANRAAGTYGKMTSMGKDRSHTKSGKLVLESRKKNRARNGQKPGSSTLK